MNIESLWGHNRFKTQNLYFRAELTLMLIRQMQIIARDKIVQFSLKPFMCSENV